MLDKFITYNQNNQLFKDSGRVLLAISGGRDSMLMLYLFKELGIDIGIAHCNFKLRQKEADQDEQFVQEIAKENNIPFYSISFNTKVSISFLLLFNLIKLVDLSLITLSSSEDNNSVAYLDLPNLPPAFNIGPIK